MQVVLNLEKGTCEITKTNDKPYKNASWGSAESTFLYHVKKELIKQGYTNIIKKRMWKDGHMVDDEMQYLRLRFNKHVYGIFNDQYVIRDAGLTFNTEKKYNLRVIDLTLDKEEL